MCVFSLYSQRGPWYRLGSNRGRRLYGFGFCWTHWSSFPFCFLLYSICSTHTQYNDYPCFLICVLRPNNSLLAFRHNSASMVPPTVPSGWRCFPTCCIFFCLSRSAANHPVSPLQEISSILQDLKRIEKQLVGENNVPIHIYMWLESCDSNYRDCPTIQICGVTWCIYCICLSD